MNNKDDAAPAPGQVQLDAQTRGQLESLARHSYGGRFAVYMSGDDARALLAAPAAPAPTNQQISDYLNGLDAIQREIVEREARAAAPASVRPPAPNQETTMTKQIKTWRERLAGLDKPTDFAEAQAAKHEAADLRRYIAELERASQPSSGEAERAAFEAWAIANKRAWRNDHELWFYNSGSASWDAWQARAALDGDKEG